MYHRFPAAIILLFFSCISQAQNGYKAGETVTDIPAKKILNYSTSSASLKSLQADITIIDFFGTWCAPCLRALPELSNYKNKFGQDIAIILVSTEEEIKLTKFIATRQPFTFPIVVDEDQLFTKAFQPPSYPYTVILDKNLSILSITNAADLTEPMLQQFIIASKALITQNKNTDPVIDSAKKDTMPIFTGSTNMLVKLSQDFMYAAKTGENVSSYITQLKDISYTYLLSTLKTDDEKKAFWINLYNAYTNTALQKNPELYKNRNTFFKNKNIIVAGKTFSLDNIEHGILRRSKIKWSLGYFSKLFPHKTEKELRVSALDYRIHFALNCGAKSCPPIAFYAAENLNSQLDLAATAYLTGEAAYDSNTHILHLPAILSWFRRDFGGKKKMVALIKAKQLIPPAVRPKIKFKKYDWTLYVNNFKK
jgi:thiol-disulfide isomerase/thioredoxin